MKSFTDLCKMSQKELKEYMNAFLTARDYETCYQDGFLYAKGKVPVLVVAHLDTVHKQKCTEITELNGKISSPQGIGGDDRCGVYIIMSLLKYLNCSVLLCEDEETGGKGAHKFVKSQYISELDADYIIEFDRKGKNDAVFYNCDNPAFTKFVCDATGYKEAHGSFSDISVIAPEAKICAVNLSCGYYNPHTLGEYVIYNEMMATVSAAKNLIETKCDAPFVYKAREYKKTDFNFDFNKWKQMSFFDDMGYDDTPPEHTDFLDIAKLIREDDEITLAATIKTRKGKEDVLIASGKTKMECWFDLFTSYTSVCLDDIVDYEFS